MAAGDCREGEREDYGFGCGGEKGHDVTWCIWARGAGNKMMVGKGEEGKLKRGKGEDQEKDKGKDKEGGGGRDMPGSGSGRASEPPTSPRLPGVTAECDAGFVGIAEIIESPLGSWRLLKSSQAGGRGTPILENCMGTVVEGIKPRCKI